MTKNELTKGELMLTFQKHSHRHIVTIAINRIQPYPLFLTLLTIKISFLLCQWSGIYTRDRSENVLKVYFLFILSLIMLTSLLLVYPSSPRKMISSVMNSKKSTLTMLCVMFAGYGPFHIFFKLGNLLSRNAVIYFRVQLAEL